ncbi:fused MFS/spermidine synthase [Paludibaculum fermentans]|uniref:Fused MFS/spermidine synthase n=1 Tax=Paludibaculum fermentans TaxID=1473598 RepID=A0A7S7NT76_PALFE|nr:fused MFS/spermidine synthase [Paludibaculum fermentans]QOY89278.1 fused MFS/spermidine synthase [Paludibaculum fermentans]
MSFLISSVIASAFCLFLVQPLLAKQILPYFGGTASVWAVCMVFYQGALLGGYLYAHGLARFLAPRRQAQVHLVVLAGSLWALPVGLGQVDSVGSGQSWSIVWMLVRAVGIPYFVLSSTSPLMQAWYARLEPKGQAYKLFGWSNLSCALALLSFPFLLEPWLSLTRLNLYWSWGYGLVVLLLAASAVIVIRRSPANEAEERREPVRPGLLWPKWLFFSALGSLVLVSVTNHLCQSVAPVPFLWTVPLLLYLLTFTAVFEREWYSRRWGMPLAGAALLAMAAAYVYMQPGRMLAVGIPVFTIGCFLACFYCHGELAALKPEPGRLTQFYLVMAAGGTLGSLLVAFVAPRIFRGYVELPVVLCVTAMAMLFSVYGRHLAVDLAAAACAILVTTPALAVFLTPLREIDAGRNFYGSLRVEQAEGKQGRPPIRSIIHGAISHGSQFNADGWRMRPTAYYGPNSGPGKWFTHTPGARRVGVVGLGAGTLAAYGRPGDEFRFYEINPMVVQFAKQHFRYLSDTPARVDIAVGDGRLLLEHEADQNFDLLVIDAFSGDSIPVHLLTREAFKTYRRHLKPGGILALHLSNLYLDLMPEVRVLAADQGFACKPVLDSGSEPDDVRPSIWALAGPAASLD